MPSASSDSALLPRIRPDGASPGGDWLDPTRPVSDDELTRPVRAAAGFNLAGRRLGDYRLQAFVGAGGMGTVYRGVRVSDRRVVAVKVLNRDSSRSEARDRFYQEARASSAARHPNIVPLLDVGEVGQHRFLVTPFIDGPDLAQLVRQTGPLREAGALAIAGALLDALAAIHTAGFVHRDVKPENILIAPDGQPMLTDFGIVRELDRRMRRTRAGEVFGTPAWMAPEQFRGERIDGRADLYATGLVLFFMLVGRAPFDGDAPELMYAHLHNRVPRLRTLRADVSPLAERVVSKALAKQPSHRFPTAVVMRTALEGRTVTGGGAVAPGASGRGNAVQENRLPAPSRRRPSSTGSHPRLRPLPRSRRSVSSVRQRSTRARPEVRRSDPRPASRADSERRSSGRHAPVAPQRALNVGVRKLLPDGTAGPAPASRGQKASQRQKQPRPHGEMIPVLFLAILAAAAILLAALLASRS